ncbi:WAS/WASL-interacting protein family member 3-like isoform X2 [Branchiostoma floridae]|uniref:WAS/WASL-interacting protein family member 3-like isoform X2 n=1 Tax=Branchiostoma floridae TaxID=7739 RepID=A0A9J7KFZ5_BRAFL|nr:WAS/WASL-interacting protein family member 3-like isoform X2 [Branchiostoma floridae]
MAKAARILKMGYLEMKLPQKKGTWQLKWCIFCILDDNSTSFLDYFSNEESFRKGGKVASIRLDAKDKLSVIMDQKMKQNCLMVDNDKGPFGFYHKDPMQMAQWQKVFLFCLTPGEGVDLSQLSAGPGTPLPPLPPTGDSDGAPPVPPIPPGHPMNAPRLPGAPSPPPYPGGQPLPAALSGLPLPPLPTMSMSGPPLPPLPTSEHNYEEGVMSMFKVAVEDTIDSKRLGLSGEYYLVISPEEIVVMERKHGKDGNIAEKEVLTWKLTTLRRFFMTVIPGEKSDQLLSIESGRRSSTGPGVFQFFTAEGDELYSCIRQCAIKGLEMIKARKAATGGQQQGMPPPQQPGPPVPGPRPPGPRQPGPPGQRPAGPPGPRQTRPPGPRQSGPPGPRQPGPPGPRQPRPPGPRQPGPPGPNQADPGKAPQTTQGPPTTPRGPNNNNQPQQANANAPNQKAAAKQPPKPAEGTPPPPPKALDRAEELKAKGVIIDDGMNPVYGQGLAPLPPDDEVDESMGNCSPQDSVTEGSTNTSSISSA